MKKYFTKKNITIVATGIIAILVGLGAIDGDLANKLNQLIELIGGMF